MKPPHPPTGCRILVIDDSPTIRSVLRVALSRAGYTVRCYATAAACREALRAGEITIPEVLILDIGLPDMNGLFLARLLKQHPHWRQTKIILYSSRRDLLHRVKSYHAGACAYLSKNTPIEKILGTVETVLAA